MPTIIDLGQLVKAKYPGTYDGLSDYEVGRRTKEKYPQYGNFTDAPEPAQQPAKKKTIGGFFKSVGNALTSSEQVLGQGLSTVGSNIPQQQANQAAQNTENVTKLLQLYRNAKDPAQKEHLANALKAMGTDVTAEDINSGFGLTNKQVLGAAAGTALDVLSAGSYGNAAKGAKTGQLLTKGGGAVERVAAKVGIPVTQRIINPVAKQVVEQTLGQTLKQIGKKTLVKSATGAATGYGYDVANRLQQDKPLSEVFKPGSGAYLGGAIPLATGFYEATKAVTKGLAPRIINSLVKPKEAQFAYGKNPGRTVSAMGITGNNLQDFGDNVSRAKQEVGSQIGAIYSSPANSGLAINAQKELNKLDIAISEAAKGGKNNQGIVTTLQNLKDALLYDHKVTAEGDIVRVSDVAKDLSKLTAPEAFDLKQKVAAATQFTGRPSDDKTVNALLKNIYGGLKQRLNMAVGVNNPEILRLNERFADLSSAEIAIRNRDKIVQRANLVSLPGAIEGGTAALAAGIMSGGAAIPVILAGATGVALDKALSSTPVKTRIAAWLGSESPGVIQKVLTPEIRTVLRRVFPKFASKIGKDAPDRTEAKPATVTQSPTSATAQNKPASSFENQSFNRKTDTGLAKVLNEAAAGQPARIKPLSVEHTRAEMRVIVYSAIDANPWWTAEEKRKAKANVQFDDIPERILKKA